MRQRGMSTVGGVLLAGLLGTLAAVAVTDWMIVDVQIADPDPIHIKVPFPLFIANVATSFVPDSALEDARIPPEVTANKELVIAAITTLLEAPDSSLVKVEAPDARVEIEKTGDNKVKFTFNEKADRIYRVSASFFYGGRSFDIASAPAPLAQAPSGPPPGDPADSMPPPPAPPPPLIPPPKPPKPPPKPPKPPPNPPRP
mgnify:CR=1 FL=1